ncbi:hypothetical protein KPL74_02145 [Bacillus sp. NP157]|nr:hypothetical protein KPL74_02145 [Bacillus sp. NP157]
MANEDARASASADAEPLWQPPSLVLSINKVLAGFVMGLLFVSALGLSSTFGFPWTVVIPFATLGLAVAVHELGHFIAARRGGMWILSVRLGPLQFAPRRRGWKMRVKRAATRGALGSVSALPPLGKPWRPVFIRFMLGGVAANAVLIALLVVGMVLTPTLHAKAGWVAAICVAVGPLVNILPFRHGMDSDGLQALRWWLHPPSESSLRNTVALVRMNYARRLAEISPADVAIFEGMSPMHALWSRVKDDLAHGAWRECAGRMGAWKAALSSDPAQRAAQSEFASLVRREIEFAAAVVARDASLLPDAAALRDASWHIPALPHRYDVFRAWLAGGGHGMAQARRRALDAAADSLSFTAEESEGLLLDALAATDRWAVEPAAAADVDGMTSAAGDSDEDSDAGTTSAQPPSIWQPTPGTRSTLSLVWLAGLLMLAYLAIHGNAARYGVTLAFVVGIVGLFASFLVREVARFVVARQQGMVVLGLRFGALQILPLRGGMRMRWRRWRAGQGFSELHAMPSATRPLRRGYLWLALAGFVPQLALAALCLLAAQLASDMLVHSMLTLAGYASLMPFCNPYSAAPSELNDVVNAWRWWRHPPDEAHFPSLRLHARVLSGAPVSLLSEQELETIADGSPVAGAWYRVKAAQQRGAWSDAVELGLVLQDAVSTDPQGEAVAEIAMLTRQEIDWMSAVNERDATWLPGDADVQAARWGNPAFGARCRAVRAWLTRDAAALAVATGEAEAEASRSIDRSLVESERLIFRALAATPNHV